MCGVCGVFGSKDAGVLTARGLHALQHRGQESGGISTRDRKEEFHTERGIGLITDIFATKKILRRLRGDAAVGHVRYSTSGNDTKERTLRNVQPFFTGMGLSLAHNGNLTNVEEQRKRLVDDRRFLQSSTDSEVIIQLMALYGGKDLVQSLVRALADVTGAYAIVAVTENELIGIRDPFGFRPLVLGKLDDAWILASETCAFDIIGATFERDIAPGECIVISKDGIKSFFPFEKQEPRFCVFEYIYFARPDSFLEGVNVYSVRHEIGRELAREANIEADVVVPIPDSGMPAAIGYAEESAIPFHLGIIRNHYVQRTFIQPSRRARSAGVRNKHNANPGVLEGKRVILVDDSIVRGTTSRKIIDMVRRAGASEVHLCISSPPVTDPCFYGIDTPQKDELLAAQHSIDEMRQIIGVDSLHFISLEGLMRAVQTSHPSTEEKRFCTACFTGKYPEKIPITE